MRLLRVDKASHSRNSISDRDRNVFETRSRHDVGSQFARNPIGRPLVSLG
jgi:hypothetical protein